MKRFSRVMVAVVVLLLAASSLTLAANEEEILSIGYYLDRHLKEHAATVQAEDQMRSAGQTVALGDIEKALELADDYVDLEVALSVLDDFKDAHRDSPYRTALAPVYRLFAERMNVAIVRGRRDLEKQRAALLEDAQMIGFSRSQVFLDQPLLRLPSDGEQSLLIELSDNRSGRRIAWLEDMVGRHGGRLINHCQVKHKGDKNDTHNILLAGRGDFLEKVHAHYGGILPQESFRVRIKLTSGGFLGKTRSELVVEPPSDFDAVKSLSWIKGNVIEQGWDYIYQNHRIEVERHGKTREIDGKEYYRVKGAQLEYEVFYPHSREIVVQEAEKRFGDLYYEVR